MRFVRIDPPGTWLQNHAVLDLLSRHRAGKRFLEVGCGAGSLSKELLAQGYEGVGIDLSADAIAIARRNLPERFALHHGSLETLPDHEPFDFAICMFVIEHIEEDAAFVAQVASRVRDGGLVILGVPGRKDHWCIEDETVGHLRRYDVEDLRGTIARAGLDPLDVWSAAVPVANLLFRVGNRIVAKSEASSRTLDQHALTLQSGIREIPWKTTFPPALRLVLNRFTLAPLFSLQQLFYRTSLGVTLIAAGRVASPKPVRP